MALKEKMNQYNRSAKIVGALFLIAMVASLFGGAGLIEPSLSAQDYLTAVSENETQVIIGALLELINGLAVLGIGVLMFPVLKQHNENQARGYLGLRIVEAVFCCMIVISPLSLIALSKQYMQAGAANASVYLTAGALSIAERAAVSNLLIPIFLGSGALILYSSLYQARLLPRFISVWGFTAAVLILALNLLLTFNVEVGLAIGMIFALPMILNEVFLGIWLIVKGFNLSALNVASAK